MEIVREHLLCGACGLECEWSVREGKTLCCGDPRLYVYDEAQWRDRQRRRGVAARERAELSGIGE